MLTALGSGIYSPSGPLNFENISGYSRAPLVSGRQENLTLCHGETFCCQASYYLLGDSYHLLVYQGLRDLAIPGMKIPVQLCGVARLCGQTVCPPGGGGVRGSRW